MKKIKYAIIDDEEHAHAALIDLMKQYDNFECIGEYYNVVKAISGLKQNKPDFIFLDIEMPNVNGFTLLEYIDKSINVIVTTSHRNYAIDGYEHDVFHFLSKPIFNDRLLKVIVKLSELYENTNIDIKIEKQRNCIDIENKYLFVSKSKEKMLLKLYIKDICCIEKIDNNLAIYTEKKDVVYYKEDNINSIINELPSNYFKIINRSTIINITKSIWIDEKVVSLKNGRTYKVTAKFN